MTNEPTYELCFDPKDSDVLVYRSIPAGICGPFSETIPCRSHTEAERIARDMGYVIAGDWQSHTNYDSVAIERFPSGLRAIGVGEGLKGYER